jgi:peptidoglycan L-alanyl-D-glutamate endopeptidase CwlK
MMPGLNPTFEQKLDRFEAELLKHGLHVRMTCGYRSIAEQNRLYAQGRTKPGKIVTQAKGGYSWHNFGLAADYVFLDADGRATYAGPWSKFGQIAESCGLEWGGSWKTFKDRPHVQWTGGTTLAKLRASHNIK